MKYIHCSLSFCFSYLTQVYFVWMKHYPVVFSRSDHGNVPWIFAYFKRFDWSFYKTLRIAWLDINSRGHNSFFENVIDINLLGGGGWHWNLWRNLRSALFFFSSYNTWYFCLAFCQIWGFSLNFNNSSGIQLNFDHSGVINYSWVHLCPFILKENLMRLNILYLLYDII